MSAPPLVRLIAGPTASGKSALALRLAAETGAVIVNADSMQLYRDLRVLTARPSAEDEALADHALYGVADAEEAWSVGRWLRAVTSLMAEVADAGRPLVLVGGTGLYFRALTEGLADVPAVPDPVRATEADLYDREGEAAYRTRLAGLDSAAETRIASGDRQRLVRAAAVAVATGKPLTAWQAETQPLLAPGAYEALVLEPDRATLYARCDARLDAMLDEGVFEEVAALHARGLDPALPALKAVGYRELAAHVAGDLPLDQALAAAKQATRNYAKRQLTWFRNQTPDWPRTLSS